jgi:hypothetical protein
VGVGRSDAVFEVELPKKTITHLRYGKAKRVHRRGTQDHLDNFSPTYATQKVKYSITGLDPGQHTIRIEVLRKKNSLSSGYVVNVDGFYIL